ncbi:hypothetical protein MUN46_006050 [Mesosutterella sp. AGMB02718]|uniref:Uncharacterized protein n=1 Tax=Mesosutterella faecium TaxID=2925194 RepID=A0ABT7IM94_9BURK|nr:hypothetical protein [Mesosutterella sp. AGMB02718]MDL2059488.1 hypothetical protein [Mesosutterella sp. AGMB02718]
MKPILFKRPAGLLPEEELAAELVMKVFPDAASAAMMLEVLQDFNSNRSGAQQAAPARGEACQSGVRDSVQKILLHPFFKGWKSAASAKPLSQN